MLVSCSSTDRSKDEYAEQCLIHDTLMKAIVGDDDENMADDDEYVITREDFKQVGIDLILTMLEMNKHLQGS